MILERFTTDGLAHHSYLLACERTRRAVVIDPRRDVDEYVAYLGDKELELDWVLETHIHADYASGARDLATQTGAQLGLSVYDEGERYEVQYDHRELSDGDVIEVGDIKVAVRHTPGHTPEHISFLVTDAEREEPGPHAMFSGDFLFIGSLGRPDLLGRDEDDRLANSLFRSVRGALAELPDHVEIHPAHGAGSMCGAGMSNRPDSKLGFERISNPYLNPDLPKEAFVRRILESAPPMPSYYPRMKQLNSDGVPPLDELPGHAPVRLEGIPALLEQGAVVVDTRGQLEFGGGHLRGAFGIGYGAGLSTWAPWVVPYDRPILLVLATPSGAEGAIRPLVRVGLDKIVGWTLADTVGWQGVGLQLEKLPQLGPQEVASGLESDSPLTLIDVRTDAEWELGHAPGARHVPLHEVEARVDELGSRDQPIAVVCGSGYRSTLIASQLQRAGFTRVANVSGGMGGWQRSELPTVTD